jgi:hypothetical protein
MSGAAGVPRRRIALGVVAIVLIVLGGAGYLAAAVRQQSVAGGGPAEPEQGSLLFVDLSDGLDRVEQVSLAAPDGARTGTPLRCQRISTAGGTTVCLRLAGPGPNYEAAVLDRAGRELRTVALPGLPSRARVSESGRIISWTTFVTGDSYTVPGGFSTRTGVLDLRTGRLIESLESFAATVDGQPFAPVGVNYWGVTVAADDRTFFATMAAGSRTWLVRGDLAARTVQAVRPGAECPSLSPDGTKVAYKKRAERLGPWELVVLDLGTGVERPLPGTAGVDDQASWLDADHLLYSRVPRTGAKQAVYRVRTDGSAPQLLIPDATSPVAVR